MLSPSLPRREGEPPPSEGLPAPQQNAAKVAIQPLPSAVAGVLWRGDALGQGVETTWSSGFPALDAELPGGGWPARQLTEVLQPQSSLAEWRLVGPALREVARDGAAVVMIGPPKRPHLPGLLHLGLDERRLVWLQAEAPSERLWCAEQLIKSNAAGAVLAWMPQAAPEQLRRLQVLAQSFEGPVFLFRPLAARHDPSPAPLRVRVEIDIDWALRVQILKRKGPAHETPLRLASIPGGLEQVLTPRVMQPSRLRPLPMPSTPRPVSVPAAASARRAPAPESATAPATALSASAALPAADALSATARAGTSTPTGR